MKTLKRMFYVVLGSTFIVTAMMLFWIHWGVFESQEHALFAFRNLTIFVSGMGLFLLWNITSSGKTVRKEKLANLSTLSDRQNDTADFYKNLNLSEDDLHGITVSHIYHTDSDELLEVALRACYRRLKAKGRFIEIRYRNYDKEED